MELYAVSIFLGKAEHYHVHEDNSRNLTISLVLCFWLFNNYVTLKLPFLTHPPPPSRFITNDHKTPAPYFTSNLTQILSPFIIYFSFWRLKKKTKIRTHP